MRTTVLAAMALLSSCDAQVGSEYTGQLLATLQGTVDNQSGLPPSRPIDAALLWRAHDMTDAIMAATPVRIEKTFPAQFTISIYLPAPASAFQASTLPYAFANVGAVTDGATPAQIAAGSAILGRLIDPLLYFFRSDVPAGLLQQHYGALKKGYHLIARTQTIDPATLTQPQIDACAAELTAESPAIARADAQLECAQSLLSHTSRELPLTTPLLLQVQNP